VPNLVRGAFEDIAQHFEANSAQLIYSNRLPAQTVDWARAAAGAHRVAAPGGRIGLNVWTRSQQQIDEILGAFRRAGFSSVEAHGGVGPGTMIYAKKVVAE
jgi:hypothetical protein